MLRRYFHELVRNFVNYWVQSFFIVWLGRFAALVHLQDGVIIIECAYYFFFSVEVDSDLLRRNLVLNRYGFLDIEHFGGGSFVELIGKLMGFAMVISKDDVEGNGLHLKFRYGQS